MQGLCQPVEISNTIGAVFCDFSTTLTKDAIQYLTDEQEEFWRTSEGNLWLTNFLMKMNEELASFHKLPLSLCQFSEHSAIVIELSTEIDVRFKGYELWEQAESLDLRPQNAGCWNAVLNANLKFWEGNLFFSGITRLIGQVGVNGN